MGRKDEVTGALMHRTDLTGSVAQRLDLPNKEADHIVTTILAAVVRSLRAGQKVEIRGFGSFRTRRRRARKGRNPKTGASVDVPPKAVAYFKPSRELAAAVRNSLFDSP